MPAVHIVASDGEGLFIGPFGEEAMSAAEEFAGDLTAWGGLAIDTGLGLWGRCAPAQVLTFVGLGQEPQGAGGGAGDLWSVLSQP